MTVEETKEMERQLAVNASCEWMEGFISRRKEANAKVRDGAGNTASDQRTAAEVAAWYNSVLNVAVKALKDAAIDQFKEALNPIKVKDNG